MSEEKRIVEVSGRRRIVREYDADGRLARIRVEPVATGATPDLPPVEAAPLHIVKKAKAEPPAPSPPPVEEELPVTLEPYEDPVPELPVTLEPYEEPAPVVAPPPPKRFEILAAEPILPEPSASPPPAPVEEELPVTLEPYEDPAPPAAPEAAPAPVVPEPSPPSEPQRSFAESVPNVDARVDALLGAQATRAKSRKRAPVPVPSFEPLRREAWEDRLDEALAGH